MPKYEVIIPIAGHAFKEVEANSEDEAIEKAMNDVAMSDIQEWDVLKQFNRGNVCYCPDPWEVEVTEIEEEE